MGVAVAGAVALGFGQRRGRVAQMRRHGLGTALVDRPARGPIRRVHRVAFRHAGEVDDGLSQGQFALGTAQALQGLPGAQAQGQGARVGVADVFAGHADHAARHVQRVAAAVKHARVPVQGAVGGTAANGLVQR